MARESGFRKREPRKLSPRAWFWATVLAFGAGPKRTLAATARLASLFSGKPLSRQGLHQRFTPEAVAFMRRACERLSQRVATLPKEALPGKLSTFEDLSLLDSTTIRLADRLAQRYPACRHNVRKAAIKIHAQMSLTHQQTERIRLTAERVHDRKGAPLGSWMRGRLLLFDLGYFDYSLFSTVTHCGGAFLSRLKTSANGTIVAARKGCQARHVGGELNRPIYNDTVVDLDVAFGHGASRAVFRVVGIFNPDLGDFHWYVTSLPPEDFSTEEIAQIYRLRWQIELLFKEMKSLCRIHQIGSGKEEVVEVMIYAGLCAVFLSRIAVWLSARRFGLPWRAICTSTALKILGLFVLPLGRALVHDGARQLRHVLSDLLDTLAVHARLPNRTNAVLDFANLSD
jgi:putative transposase